MRALMPARRAGFHSRRRVAGRSARITLHSLRQHADDEGFFLAEVFGGDALDFFGADVGHDAGEFLEVVPAAAVEIVPGEAVGHAGIALLGSQPGAAPGHACAVDLISVEAIGGEVVDLRHEFLLGEFDLLRIGADVEVEGSRTHGGKVLRSNVVGEAQLLADAIEKAAAHVAAGFVDEAEGMHITVFEADGAEADDEDGLLLVEMLGPRGGFGAGVVGAAVGTVARAFG